MNLLFYSGHPAQYHFLKLTAKELRNKGHNVYMVIKSKDILENLLKDNNEEYFNILPEERGRSKFQILWSLFIREVKLFRFARKYNIDLIVGTDASLAHIGKILGKPCITTLEDDYTVIKNLAYFTFPFSTSILVPNICDVGRWHKKKIGYEGYMKLAYMHPNRFIPEREKLGITGDLPYYLIRLSGLSAYHDFGINGISFFALNEIIARLSTKGKVYISSEKTLPAEYDPYLLKIPVSDLHHYLCFSEMLICDSQSMAMEAAMLGVPSIRISGFAGRISVLEELEYKYELTFGIKPGDSKSLNNKLDELLNISDLKEVFQIRRNKMLSEKIDVTAFLIWFIENYPESENIMRNNPDYQFNFK